MKFLHDLTSTIAQEVLQVYMKEQFCSVESHHTFLRLFLGEWIWPLDLDRSVSHFSLHGQFRAEANLHSRMSSIDTISCCQYMCWYGTLGPARSPVSPPGVRTNCLSVHQA